MTIAYILFLLLMPAFIACFFKKSPALETIGIVNLNFLFGVILSNILLYLNCSDIIKPFDILMFKDAQTTILDISIILALPLIIVSFSLKTALYAAKDILFAMLLSVASMIMISFILAIVYDFLIPNQLEYVWQHISLAFATYTGGAVNMSVIQSAAGVDKELFLAMTNYDMYLSFIYLVFTFAIGIPFARKVLPTHPVHQVEEVSAVIKTSVNEAVKEKMNDELQEASDSNTPMQMVISVVLAALMVGGALILSHMLPDTFSRTVIMATISTVALLASMISAINTYRLGHYLLMVFFFTIASTLDVTLLMHLDFAILGFFVLFIWGGFFIHLLLCKLCKVDADSFLVTSVASIMSLPFVPLIISRLNNRQLLIPGLAVSILGYVVGTYVGVFLAYMLKWMSFA